MDPVDRLSAGIHYVDGISGALQPAREEIRDPLFIFYNQYTHVMFSSAA